MPYKDPEQQKAAKRASAMRRRREVAGEQMTQTALAAELPAVLPDPPDRDELIRILGVQARLGSVQAAKLLLDRLDKETDGAIRDDPVADLIHLGDRKRA
jgi:hypothetical protein